MVNYEEDLSEERRLNQLLKAKLKQSDERIATLEALSAGKRDPFRDLLLKELGVDNRKKEAPAEGVAPADSSAYPDGLLKIVRFIGGREVGLTEVAPFVLAQNIGDGKDARRVMFDYKKTGLLDNYRRGFYRLSPAGLKLLAEKVGSDPA
jgi:hypothetical protein